MILKAKFPFLLSEEDRPVKKTKAFGIFMMAAILFFPFCSSSRFRTEEKGHFEISFSKFVLDNGLTLIVHEDHKAPLAAVQVSYRVGSKNEKLGRTGFAHLFEHLMVNGSEHHNEDWFESVAALGATDDNAETWFDETKYYVTVPVSSLDPILWLESDRMGHLLGAISREKLEGQKEIVTNEISQILNEPYGKADQQFWEYIYPEGHPYSWPVIGSADDIRGATLDAVKEWFSTFYGPSNAVLVIAGDVETVEMKKKVEKYFGYLQPGRPIDRYSAWIGRRSDNKRAVCFDDVPQPRISLIWNIPNWSSRTGHVLSLAADILASGNTSRLRKRLVEEGKLASDVKCEVELLELSGVLKISAVVNENVDADQVEAVIREEIDKLAEQGPLPSELEKVKIRRQTDFILSTERLGGGNGKAQQLAGAEILDGDPGRINVNMRTILNATARDVREAADEWLKDGSFIQEVRPNPVSKTAKLNFDRLKIPAKGEQPDMKLPALQRFVLSNGLKVILAEWPWMPVIRFNLLVNAGFASDKSASIGTSRLTSSLLNVGTETRASHQLKTELERLGTTLGVGGNLDFSSISMTTMKTGFDRSLDIFSDVVLHPSFPENEFASAKESFMARISQEESSNISLALRILPRILYGPNHAYGIPYSGLLNKESTAALTLIDVKKFYETWFRPGNSTLVIVGDITAEELKPRLEIRLGKWPSGDIPEWSIANIQQDNKSVIYLIDRPNSTQTGIAAAQLIVPKNHNMDNAISVAHSVLAGSSTKSRIGKNLRAEKHWAYMAFSMIVPTKGQRYYVVYTPVQAYKTAESMKEIKKELEGFIGAEPITEAELSDAKKAMTFSLPGEFETGNAIMDKIVPLVRHGLPDDYYERYVDKINALTSADIMAAAREAFKPDDLVWLVMGDRKKIEESLKKLGFGEVISIDVGGHLLK